MSRIKLDLKHFKHVKSDEHSTTLQHNDGHQLTLAHKALSPDSRVQLQALAQSAAKPENAGMKRQEAQVAMAKGSDVQEYAEGTDNIQPPPSPEVAPAPDVKEMLKFDPSVQPAAPDVDQALARKRELYNQVASGTGVSDPDQAGSGSAKALMFGKDGSAPQQMDPSAWERAQQMYSQEEAGNAANAAGAQQETIRMNAARTQAGLPPLPVPNVPQGPQIPGSEMNPAPPQADQLPQAPQAGGMGGAMDATQGLMEGGFQKQMAGINAGAEAQGQLGQEQAQILQRQQSAQQDAQIAYKQQYDDLEKERQAHMQDIKNAHIDPNKYWTGDKDGNGSHSKLMTGIGMILAGFNPTSAPNAAINFLNHNMEMNLQAQKENLGSEQNLLSANLRQFGNLKDATDMTRLMQADMVHNQLLEAAAKAASPMAKAAAQQAAGQLMQQFAPLQQQFAMRRAMMNLTNGANGGDPSNTDAAEHMIALARMTNPEMAKEMESRLIPGVGMAKVPVPEGARAEMIAKNSLNSAGQDLLKYSKTHSNIIPGTPEYNYGVTKAMAFQQKVREGLLGTVFRESEKPLLEKFVKENPAGALKAFSTQPQLKAILESNMMGLNAQKQGYGLPSAQVASPTDLNAAKRWLQLNPNHPKAAAVRKQLNGK